VIVESDRATLRARKVILVEGMSDVLAVRATADRAGRDLDAEGITVLSLDGGGGFDAQVKRLGPSGLGLELLGLCDLDHEARWARGLEDAGLGSQLDRAGLEALGFFVCDRDLEDEFIKTLGVAEIEKLIASQGESYTLGVFAQQPAHRGENRVDQLRRFFGTKGGRKARYAPLLVAATTPGGEPRPLREVVARA
jgi:hypothetical protein